MRILLVGDYPADPRLGSAKVYFKLAEELRALGHAADLLLAPEIGAGPAGWRARQTVGPWLADRAIRRAFRERGPYDVVDVAGGEGALFALRRRLSLACEPAVVARSHGLEHLNYRRTLEDAREGLISKPWTRRIWYPAVRLSQVAAAARLADALVVANPGDRAFALRAGWKGEAGVRVVPHGVSERFLAESPAADAPRGEGILFCGSWDAVKGAPHLAAAMGLLAADAPAAPRLTVLGPGVPEEAVLASFPAAARRLVRVVPRTGEEEVMRHYRAHDLLVFPSTYEGFGMVVVEAMSQGLPVVATPVGCTPELVRDGETGALVPRRDPAGLASALRRLLADAPLRRRLGAAAAAAVRGLTWRRAAERTLEVYAAAMGPDADPLARPVDSPRPSQSERS
jgi:glycosyltransferase involved in cell wall biosynthesis